jgi:dTDP-4-amino-4,6-dideoxygalactose transaminase/RimJ/RimL family protein N-acetyltransferase
LSGDRGELTLRSATIDDADMLLEWANDPTVRAASFSSAPIDRTRHVAWLEARLANDGTAFYVAEVDGRPIGYSRIDRVANRVGEITVSVDAAVRGLGHGRRVIALAAQRAAGVLALERVRARVKAENRASVKAFEAAGFAMSSVADPVVLEWDVPVVPHSRPRLDDAAVAAVVEVLRSGFIAHGAVAERLEQRWCDLTGTAAAAAVGSGVAALRLALLGLGVGPGDEVVVPAYSCIALLNAPLSLGARPVLADVVRDAWTLDPEDTAARVTPRTRAIVAVDLFGAPSPLPRLEALGVPVVEDCAHGIGGCTAAGRFGGGSAVGISSFYATKMIGAGEGGIVAARDPAVVERAVTARNYGDRLPDGRHLNDKLTDIGAALALEQLEHLGETLALRAERAARYDELLGDLEAVGALALPPRLDGRIWYRYTVRLTGADAAAVCERMRAARVHAERPVWDLRAAEQWTNDLPVTAEAFNRVVSLPLYPDLTREEQERVAAALKIAVA